MPKTQELQERYGQRMLEILQEAKDPLPLMRQLASEAEASGLIPEAGMMRLDSPEEFVMDLWLDNPAALDWLSAREWRLQKPSAMQEFDHLLSLVQ